MHVSTRHATVIAFFTCTLLIYIITAICARDPTSFYFNPRKGYAPRYSAIRQQQAEAFISSYDPANVVKTGDASRRKLCVGIPTVAREDKQHLQDVIGSLLDGLTPGERQEIYLMVFIAQSTPAKHPAYNEEWLSGLADKIVTYGFGADRLQYIVDMEEKEKVDEKGLFDYAFILDKCTEQYTPYIAIIEDDAIAIDGWYHRTINAIEEAERQAALKHAKSNFLYLRLFYTEEFLGWHRQYWWKYLLSSIFIALIPTGAIYCMRYSKSTNKLSYLLWNRRILLYIYAGLAGLILIFFSLGRLTVYPISEGVHEMQKFGCCSEALVFPNDKALELVLYFKERHLGYADVLIEDFANGRGGLRYAISPSLFQHVGRKIGTGDEYGPMGKWGMTIAEKIWSFSFERFDWQALKKEHAKVAQLRESGLQESIIDR